MPRKTVDLGSARPLLDIVSYGRKGPTRRDRLSLEQVDHIRRTVERVPEVMIKVLSKGGCDSKAVRRHLEYLSRRGELDLETDEGERVTGKDALAGLLDDWNLDVDEHRPRNELLPSTDARPPRLVHKLMFSMPAGTPPEKVLQAVRNFATEEFALQHRYAMVLHTDEPHPHVHMVVKAVGEQGERLNIRKDTLRHWRAEFARHLRALGVAANATERAVRGEVQTPKVDGIYRAMLRGDSTHMRERVQSVANDIATHRWRVEHGKSKLLATRSEVLEGWRAVSHLLMTSNQVELARRVRDFAVAMPSAHTEREWIRQGLLDGMHQREQRSNAELQRTPLDRSP